VEPGRLGGPIPQLSWRCAEPRSYGAGEAAVRNDSRLDDSQKSALLAVLASMVASSADRSEDPHRKAGPTPR
jgi:hypothetical protein